MLKATRDSIMLGQMADGKAISTLSSAGLNGKTFSFVPGITAAEKPVVLTAVLVKLGEVEAPTPQAIFGAFSALNR